MKMLAGRLFPVLMLLPLPLAAQNLLIKDLKRIHTAEGEVLEDASIYIHKGRILAIGKGLDPKGVPVIDGRGLEATPGLIDAHSHIAIEGGVNEGTDVVTPEVRVADVINPEDPAIYRALAGGTTCAHLMHGSANVIGGQNAVVKLKWKSSVDDMLMEDAPGSVKFALGENPKRSNFRRRAGSTRRRFPATRMGVEAVIRGAFDDALRYRAKLKAHERRLAAGERSLPPERNLRLEALLDILDGRLRIHCHSYRSDEILMMLRLAEDYGLKVAVFHHALEAYRVAPEIARHGAGVATFSDWWAYKSEAYDATPYNARICLRAGVLTSIKSDSGDLIRRLNVEAAKTVKYGGLGAEEALGLVTINPARQLGIDKRVGSLAEGKDGDVVLWNGDPLSSLSHVTHTIVEGKIEFDRAADLARRKGPRRAMHPEGAR